MPSPIPIRFINFCLDTIELKIVRIISFCAMTRKAGDRTVNRAPPYWRVVGTRPGMTGDPDACFIFRILSDAVLEDHVFIFIDVLVGIHMGAFSHCAGRIGMTTDRIARLVELG